MCADVEKSGSGGQQKDIGSFNEASAQEAEAGGIFVLVAGEGGQPVVAAGGINVQVVDKVRRKLRGSFEMPVINARPASTYIVEKVQTVWSEQRNSLHLSHVPLFNISKAHLPRDSSSVYFIVDMFSLIPEVGTQSLSIREFAYKERKDIVKQMENMGWVPKDTDPRSIRLHKAEFMIDPNEFFRANLGKWKDILGMWVTENLDKDERLIDSFKATQIPFIKGSPGDWMPYASHSFWLTNSGTGKSTFCEISGRSPSIDLSIAGLYGGNFDNYKQQQVGSLAGYGMFLIDEVEQLRKYEYSSQVVLSLLTYLEKGSVTRDLKIPITCEGKKDVIFASNPKTNDPLDSVYEFLNILQGDSDPVRMGRRIAFFLFGNDFKRIRIERPIPALRAIVPKLIQYSLLKYWDKKIVRILKNNMQWVNDVDKRYIDIQHTFESKSRACPNKKIGSFILGLGYGLHRLRMSALRILILDNLDKIVSGLNGADGSRFTLKHVLKLVAEEREMVFMRLVSHNLRSVDNLIIEVDKLQPTKECAHGLRVKFPQMSYQEMAELLSVSKATIVRWFNAETEK